MKPTSFAYFALRFDSWLRSTRHWRAIGAYEVAHTSAVLDVRFFHGLMRKYMGEAVRRSVERSEAEDYVRMVPSPALRGCS